MPLRTSAIPVAIDLFSGCGGLTQGLKQAGVCVRGAIELDPLAVETYRANHPEVHVHTGDIRRVNPNSFLDRMGLRPGDVDLIAGCPPCQGFSTIRTLNGKREVHDPRNDLIAEFLRFVEGVRPRAVMLENVPGLAADPRFSAFNDRLGELGYVSEHRIVDAADYGVPQRRRRLILLACLDAVPRFPAPSGERKTVREAIGRLEPPHLCCDPLHNYDVRRSKRIEALIRAIPHDGGGREGLPDELRLDCHKRCGGFKDVYGRMRWDDVAPTITGGCINPSKGRFLHPDQDRAITLREAALLQSFPPSYEFSLRRGRFAVADMIGNAFPPAMIVPHASIITAECSQSEA